MLTGPLLPLLDKTCNGTLVLKSQTVGQPVNMLLSNSFRLSTLDLLSFQFFWDVIFSSWVNVS